MSSFVSQLPLSPLGAGDLIDRAVRLYRRHLFVLIRTAAPPVILASTGWIIFSLVAGRMFLTDDMAKLALYATLTLVSLAMTAAGHLFTLVVMGGATRTLVAHLLRNDPVTARATYKAVRARFWGLVAASLLIFIWIVIALIAAWVVLYIALILVSGVALLIAFGGPPWLSAVIFIVSLL